MPITNPTPDENYVREVMENLTSHGYAVVVWTPEEIGDADPELLQDIAIERGAQYLDEVN